MTIKDKIQEYASLQRSVIDLENQINELKALKDEAEGEMQEIKKELKEEMIHSGKRKAIIAGWKLNLSTSTSTIIEEEDMIPEEFWKIERKPDVMKIKESLKLGINVDGAILRKNTNLSINPVN
jgi:DNA gyrase/topoisomerase IV subunit A